MTSGYTGPNKLRRAVAAKFVDATPLSGGNML